MAVLVLTETTIQDQDQAPQDQDQDQVSQDQDQDQDLQNVVLDGLNLVLRLTSLEEIKVKTNVAENDLE